FLIRYVDRVIDEAQKSKSAELRRILAEVSEKLPPKLNDLFQNEFLIQLASSKVEAQKRDSKLKYDRIEEALKSSDNAGVRKQRLRQVLTEPAMHREFWIAFDNYQSGKVPGLSSKEIANRRNAMVSAVSEIIMEYASAPPSTGAKKGQITSVNTFILAAIAKIGETEDMHDQQIAGFQRFLNTHLHDEKIRKPLLDALLQEHSGFFWEAYGSYAANPKMKQEVAKFDEAIAAAKNNIGTVEKRSHQSNQAGMVP